MYACTKQKLTHVNMFPIGFRKVRKVGYAPMIGISGLTDKFDRVYCFISA